MLVIFMAQTGQCVGGSNGTYHGVKRSNTGLLPRFYLYSSWSEGPNLYMFPEH